MYDCNTNDGYDPEYAELLRHGDFDSKSLEEAEYDRALIAKADRWVVACGGKEPVQKIEGRRFQLLYNPALHERAYWDLDQDLILTAGMEHLLPQCLKS